MLYASEEPGKVMEISPGLGRSRKYLFTSLKGDVKGHRFRPPMGNGLMITLSALGVPEAATHATYVQE